MAVYRIAKDSLFLTEHPMYGEKRLGVIKENKFLMKKPTQNSIVTPVIITAGKPPVKTSIYTLGKKHYETTDWLGNVRVTYTDKKSWNNGNFALNVSSTQDYYPFGAVMQGRKYNLTAYRYAFNTQERVPELNESHYTALYWEYDARLARRWNRDPKPSVGVSDYAVNGNSPLQLNDPNGDCPICISAAVGAIIGGLVGGGLAAIRGGNWKDVAKGVAAGFVGGAIVGSGAGIISAGGISAGLGLTASTGSLGTGASIGITALAGGISGGASSIVTQGAEILEGTRDELSRKELTTDILIGVPTALFGGVVGNSVTAQLEKEALRSLTKSIQKTATKEYKSLIKKALKEQYPSLGNHQINKIANATIKTIQQGAKKQIEAVRVTIQAGTMVGIEGIQQIGSGAIDKKVGN